MGTVVTKKLAELVDAIESLPEPTQFEILAEIENRIETLKASALTDEQRETIRERLAAPRQYAARADVMALLRRFNPAL